MDSDFELSADEGELDGDVLTTPNYACDITVTAERRGKSGSTTCLLYTSYMENCGITDGYTQERTSAREEYTPDFDLSGV